jgi:hypothetical protein
MPRHNRTAVARWSAFTSVLCSSTARMRATRMRSRARRTGLPGNARLMAAAASRTSSGTVTERMAGAHSPADGSGCASLWARSGSVTASWIDRPSRHRSSVRRSARADGRSSPHQRIHPAQSARSGPAGHAPELLATPSSSVRPMMAALPPLRRSAMPRMMTPPSARARMPFSCTGRPAASVAAMSIPPVSRPVAEEAGIRIQGRSPAVSGPEHAHGPSSSQRSRTGPVPARSLMPPISPAPATRIWAERNAHPPSAD